MLATNFENIKMHENQIFSSFYSELGDLDLRYCHRGE